MWKLLSGIALILVLDVVFIWMMALEPEAPEIAQAIGPTAAVPVVHEQPVSATEVDDSVELQAYDPENMRESRVFRVSKRHGTQPSRRFEPSRTVSAGANTPWNLFQDTIIWIGRTEVPVKIEREPLAIRNDPHPFDEVQVDVSTAEPREVKKRSFQSKMIGVIKKPYDLMKAFADKIN